MQLIKTTSIGCTAFTNLARDHDAYVLGKTSKGLFINIPDRRLIFLSLESFRGPLTITLDEIESGFNHVTPGDPAWIKPGSILFPDADFIISTEGSEIWQPAPASRPLEKHEQYQNLLRISDEVILKKSGVGLSRLIPFLLGSPNVYPESQLFSPINWDDILEIQSQIRNSGAEDLALYLTSLLGAGQGLTPSADDFTIGLLLSLNRWRNLLLPNNSLQDFNHMLVKAANKRTTLLSANLIECAASGLADERLINTLDFVVTGVAREPEIVPHLLNWGNSSGIDAFVGMLVSLTT